MCDRGMNEMVRERGSEKSQRQKVQGGPCPWTTTLLPPPPVQSRRQRGDLRASCSCARGWGSGTIWGGSFNNSSVSSSSTFCPAVSTEHFKMERLSLPLTTDLPLVVVHSSLWTSTSPATSIRRIRQATFVLKPTHHAKHSRTPPLSTHTAPSAARGPTRSTPRPIAPDERRVRASWSAQRPTR